MKKILIFFLLAVFVLLISCRTTVGPENPEQISVIRNFSYGEHERHKFDLYIPEHIVNNNIVIYIHGGGFTSGDKEAFDRSAGLRAKKGYISATINYRYLSEEVSVFDMLDDIDAAIDGIKSQLAKLGYDCKNAILIGHSAGAHLVSMYGYSRGKQSPMNILYLVEMSGTTDLSYAPFFEGKQYSENREYLFPIFSLLIGKKVNENNWKECIDSLYSVSPISFVDASSIPTIICHGNKDDLIPYAQSSILDDVLSSYHVEHQVITYKKSGHNLSVSAKEAVQLEDRITEILNQE